ncbi:ABC transporter ATP-binding protein [Synergistales bacterium]|nr:ABC transporter ATP-binding protein [Synergistales bacterium]
MNILSGIFPATSGAFSIDGKLQGANYDVYSANRQGVRTVFQELSLCLNLSVVENMRIFHPEFHGLGWAKRAGDSIMSTLSAVFPGRHLRPHDLVGNMTLGQRQTLEIAKGFAENKANPLRLLILDEPTSALDYQTARQLLNHIAQSKGQNVAFIYISHILDEVLFCADRVVAMKDGAVVGQVKAKDATRDYLISMMGSVGTSHELRAHAATRKSKGTSASNFINPKRDSGYAQINLNQGEIVGLAGLAGHGQTALLIDLFTKKSIDYDVKAPVTFIPGDRQKDGILPLWSILFNMTSQTYAKIRKKLSRLIDLKKEKQVGEHWKDAVDLKAGGLGDNILSLSGGNQQKVLFARALESDAPVVLMDDPTRGVDVGTKKIIYDLIFTESAKGRGFVWYTTEMDELQYCDRVYIFKSGQIVAEMPGEAATEEAILKASF